MRYRYRTFEFGVLDVHLRSLRDTNEFDDPDGLAESLGIPEAMWPLFGVVWPSSIALAATMVDIDIEGRRILELGCGLGLASLVLAKRGANITATDRHPSVATFLAHNAALNDLAPIPFVRSDWLQQDDELGRFDLIIGSDVLHDRDQALPLSRFVLDHAEPRNETILVDPGRGQANAFARHLEAEGYTTERQRAVEDLSLHLSDEVGQRVHIQSFRRG